ncbi:MAG: methionyl-tRNA formyltransferase, partial [Prevotella pectinovora]
LVNASDYKLQLEVIQLSGKKRMEARDFLNGKDVSGWKVKL